MVVLHLRIIKIVRGGVMIVVRNLEMKCKCCELDYINDLMIGELCSCRNNEVCETNHCYRIGVGDNEPHICKESK